MRHLLSQLFSKIIITDLLSLTTFSVFIILFGRGLPTNFSSQQVAIIVNDFTMDGVICLIFSMVSEALIISHFIRQTDLHTTQKAASYIDFLESFQQ